MCSNSCICRLPFSIFDIARTLSCPIHAIALSSLAPCYCKMKSVLLAGSLQIRSLRKWSFLSEMVLPLLCKCGCSLSKCHPMMYCVSLIPMYSRAICAMTALFSRGASSLEKLKAICPTAFLTLGFICACPINPCAIVSFFFQK